MPAISNARPMSPYQTPSSLNCAGIRDSFSRRPVPGSNAEGGVVVGTGVAVGAAVDVGIAVDVGGRVDVGVIEPSHAAKINNRPTIPTSRRVQYRVVLDLKRSPHLQ